MKKILTVFLLILAKQSISQNNPNSYIFNSISTGEDSLQGIKLISNYYTLRNNINVKSSSVYIADNPTKDQILQAATTLPSDFFIITRSQQVVNMVMLVNSPSRKFMILDPATSKHYEVDCSLKGDITENRATEIISANYDAKATIDGNQLYFNNRKLTIISNEDIKQSLVALINKEKLYGSAPSATRILSKDELRKMVVTESKEGGKLDFFTPIKGQEFDGVQVKPGVFTTRMSLALYKWGRTNFDLGVNTIDDALAFWAEIKGRQANEREKAYITSGFNKEFEK